MRDIKLILGLNRNYFILNNLREKYILVDDNNIVVYASSMFIELFDIRIEEQLSFNELKKRIEKEAVIYESSVNLNDFQFNENKVHFNMQSREIDLPFYKKAGTFYLFYDDTASQKYINSIQYIKTHDLMTELYNRNYLEEIRVILDKNDKHYHLIMFDLDGLKLFNDYLGHQAGDQLLIRFAKKLSNLSDHKNVIPIRLG
jgi:predicted signal transduction protein with EAL and GGDEF domain